MAKITDFSEDRIAFIFRSEQSKTILSSDFYLLKKNLLYSIPAVSDECTIYNTCPSEGKSFK